MDYFPAFTLAAYLRPVWLPFEDSDGNPDGWLHGTPKPKRTPLWGYAAKAKSEGSQSLCSHGEGHLE